MAGTVSGRQSIDVTHSARAGQMYGLIMFTGSLGGQAECQQHDVDAKGA
ncbi:hypothetical protein AB0N81_31700 [Streptomyces sp. NPDC093510]